MFLEPHCVVVNRADWAAAAGGDEAARLRLIDALDGLELYQHALPIDETTEQVITIDALCDYARAGLSAPIVQAVTLRTKGG